MEQDPINNLCTNLANTKIKTITLDEAVIKVAEAKVALSLVGKVLSTRKVNREAFQAIIPTFGEHYGGNIYVFHFNSELERMSMHREGPWSFNNSLLVIEELKGCGDISKMRFDGASFWVQIHNLLVICMNKDVGWFLSSQLGKVEDIDGGAFGDWLGKFLRVRINIDISKPIEKALNLIRKVGEEPITLDLAYERLPKFCYFCGMLGHSNTYCITYKP